MILDCTLRDGGYYVDWDFDENTVCKYLAAVSIAKIDIVELGFRFLPQQRFLGALAYTGDEYLETLVLPADVAIAVMVNAADLLGYEEGDVEAVYKLFDKKESSEVDIVRIAAYAKDVKRCKNIAKTLHVLGYRVFLNIMQVDALSENEITGLSRIVDGWSIIEVLYFADSFGNMGLDKVKTTILSIQMGWNGKIGIHAHDNKGQALINSLAALDHGVDYVDATLLGMGRGAGNVKLENLLVEVSQKKIGAYFPDAIFPLVLQEFSDLQEKYRWGPNIYYFLSAVHGIHPTYVQEMLSGELYDTEQVLSAINFLKSTPTPFYSFEKMLRATSGLTGDEHGEWSATGWASGRDVLIIAPGPETGKHINAIEKYAKKKKPIVLCLNVNSLVPNEIVTAYIACHETRILIESDLYRDLNKPLILPLSRIPETIKETLSFVEILDFGMRIEKDNFQIQENGCVISNSLSLIYAIAVATAGGANKILVSGADGYELSDPRHQEVAKILQIYNKLDVSIPIQSITKTSYSIVQRSVYDPSV